jgi:hypothetical protein
MDFFRIFIIKPFINIIKKSYFYLLKIIYILFNFEFFIKNNNVKQIINYF